MPDGMGVEAGTWGPGTWYQVVMEMIHDIFESGLRCNQAQLRYYCYNQMGLIIKTCCIWGLGGNRFLFPEQKVLPAWVLGTPLFPFPLSLSPPLPPPIPSPLPRPPLAPHFPAITRGMEGWGRDCRGMGEVWEGRGRGKMGSWACQNGFPGL